MTTKSGIEYITKRAIKRDGKIIGWWLYEKGILGALRFVGYLWRTN